MTPFKITRIWTTIICLNTSLTFCNLVKILDLFLIALIYTFVLVKKKYKKKKKENGKKYTRRQILWLIYAFVHLGDSLAYQVPIANTAICKCSFPPNTVCKYTVCEIESQDLLMVWGSISMKPVRIYKTSWPIFHDPLTLDFSQIIKVKIFVQGRPSRPVNGSKLIFHMRMYTISMRPAGIYKRHGLMAFISGSTYFGLWPGYQS